MINNPKLPRTLMITGADPTYEEAFIKKCLTHFQQGIKLVQLRAKELQKNEYRALAEKVLLEAKRYDVRVILNCEPSWIKGLDTSGLHLNSTQLMLMTQRPLSSNFLLSAACHNQEQLFHAQAVGVDWVTLSPVQPTQSHPAAKPLGWSAFASLCQSVNLPIYALGGMSEAELKKARSYGAYGIAAIRSLWDKNYK